MSVEIYRDLGSHSAEIKQLQADVKAMRDDLAEIKTLLDQTKGSVRVLFIVGSVGGFIGGALVKIVTFLKGGV